MATVQENQPPNAGIEKEDVITSAGHHDVLLGRGGGTNNHIGNKNFRQLVNDHKKRYLACSKVDKPKIARDVVEIWQKLDPPGRFLQKTSGGHSRSKEPAIYEEVSAKKAREKASQCLRERTSDVAPYINKYHQEQDKATEQGVEKIKEKMNVETKKSRLATKNTATLDQSTSAAVPNKSPRNNTAQAQQQIVQAAQSHQSDLGLQQLYARQQQNLRQAYIGDTNQGQILQQNGMQPNRMQPMQPNAMQPNAMQSNAMQSNAMQPNAMQPNAMQPNAMQPNAMQQTAMQMARQQAFHEQQVLEHQTKILLQQQMAMQEQLLKNNIMAQQLMLQRNGFAMAAAQQAAVQGMPVPGTPEAARRMSLNTGFSQMDIKNNGVSPGHHVPSSPAAMQHHHHHHHHGVPRSPALHNSPAVHGTSPAVHNGQHCSPAVHNNGSPAIHGSPVVSGQMRAHKIASIPVQPNLTERNMAHQIPLDTNHAEVDNSAIIEYSAHLEKREQDENNKSQLEHKQQLVTPESPRRKSPAKTTIPKMIATNSSDDLDAIKPATVSSSDTGMTEKGQNGLPDHPDHDLHDSGKISHFSEYDGTLEEYHTGLNDRGSHVFDDDSSEEMLKDHSTLREHSSVRDDLQSTESCDHSLPRKKGGRKNRISSKNSVMSMSIGSLSGMDYSAEDFRDHKMNSSRSFGSNRSLMSELTDYQDLVL